LQTEPANKLFSSAYRKRYPRGCAAHAAYEQACDQGADAETRAKLNAAYERACTADEKERVAALANSTFKL
jgi:hypothetical protein